MRKSSNHFSTGSKVRIAGWIALCQRYQCLWWVFLRRGRLTMKKVDLVDFSMIQNSQMYSIDVAFTMSWLLAPPEKQKGLHWPQAKWTSCVAFPAMVSMISRMGFRMFLALSPRRTRHLGGFSSSPSRLRFLANDHGHPGNIQWPMVIMEPSRLNYTCITERLIKYSIYNMYIYI